MPGKCDRKHVGILTWSFPLLPLPQERVSQEYLLLSQTCFTLSEPHIKFLSPVAPVTKLGPSPQGKEFQALGLSALCKQD